MSDTRYKIVRMYRDKGERHVVRCNLTLEEAKEHCRHPETSSSTCTSWEGLRETQKMGAWFDGYEEE